jgi:hypothetical protein
VRWTSKVEAVSQRPSSRWRDAQAQHVGRLEVHDQIDPVGLLDWKVFWSGTPQDSGDEAGGKLINRRQTRSVEPVDDRLATTFVALTAGEISYQQQRSCR